MAKTLVRDCPHSPEDATIVCQSCGDFMCPNCHADPIADRCLACFEKALLKMHMQDAGRAFVYSLVLWISIPCGLGLAIFLFYVRIRSPFKALSLALLPFSICSFYSACSIFACWVQKSHLELGEERAQRWQRAVDVCQQLTPEELEAYVWEQREQVLQDLNPPERERLLLDLLGEPPERPSF